MGLQSFRPAALPHFLKSYSEGLWGISCRELDAGFAAQRIKKLSLYLAIKSALFRSNSKKHRTLIDEFAFGTLSVALLSLVNAFLFAA